MERWTAKIEGLVRAMVPQLGSSRPLLLCFGDHASKYFFNGCFEKSFFTLPGCFLMFFSVPSSSQAIQKDWFVFGFGIWSYIKQEQNNVPPRSKRWAQVAQTLEVESRAFIRIFPIIPGCSHPWLWFMSKSGTLTYGKSLRNSACVFEFSAAC